MGYQGNYPPSTPLTSSQIGAGAVDTTAIANGAVIPADLSTGGPYWDPSGNVGIGTTGPTFTAGGGVMVSNATQANYRLADGTNYVDLLQNSGAGYLWNRAANFLSFGTSNTERMRIDSSGNVGIGVTPAGKFQVAAATDINLGIYNATTITGAVTLEAINNARSLNIPMELRATKFNFTGPTSPFVIDTSGNVGIGTSSPAYLLDIVPPSATATNGAIVGNTSRPASAGTDYRNGWFLRRRDNTNPTSYGMWTSSDTSGQNYWENLIIGAAGGGSSIVFCNSASSSPAERMRIDNSGNLMVGTTGAQGRLTVVPTTNSYSFASNAPNSSGTYYHAIFLANGTTNGTIASNGTTTTYSTTSDHRLKENVTPMTTGLEKISALKPVTYDWISDKSKGEGFIAYELQEVIPAAVTGEKDAVDEDGKIVPQGVDYSKIVVHLVAAIQELKAELDALKGTQ
jgi:hypothetical protein